MRLRGLRIESVHGPVTGQDGPRPGDVIVRLNGHPVEDELDYRFHAGDGSMELMVRRAGSDAPRVLRLSPEAAGGLGFAPMVSRRCRNRCVFCFVDQLPGGMRPSLYVKDEDYRFSFLYGNYVTLASVRDEELDRIGRLRLQPLYVSVHATDPAIRNTLLGRKRSRDVLAVIEKLAGYGIEMHAQIVLCPGLNDGDVLVRTVRDLAAFHPAVGSAAVVPVGLTRYRRARNLPRLPAVSKGIAERTINIIRELQHEYEVLLGDRFVYLSDEFYRKAGQPLPAANAYGEFPQWENGVGMLPLFRQQWEGLLSRGRPRPLKQSPDYLAVTGELAYPFLEPFLRWVREAHGIKVDLLPVRNRFFGPAVTVAGLITGRDVIDRVKRRVRPGSVLLVPDVMLNRPGGRFLDDVEIPDLEKELGLRGMACPTDPEGFVRSLRQDARQTRRNLGQT